MEQKYHIDGELVEWKEIIDRARRDYGYDGEILQTSVAAGILRKNGHKVGDASELLKDPPSQE